MNAYARAHYRNIGTVAEHLRTCLGSVLTSSWYPLPELDEVWVEPERAVQCLPRDEVRTLIGDINEEASLGPQWAYRMKFALTYGFETRSQAMVFTGRLYLPWGSPLAKRLSGDDWERVADLVGYRDEVEYNPPKMFADPRWILPFNNTLQRIQDEGSSEESLVRSPENLVYSGAVAGISQLKEAC